MNAINTYYSKLGLIAISLLLILVVVQIAWMLKGIDIQQEENQLQLEKKVTVAALAIKSKDQNILKQIESKLTTEKIEEIKSSIDSLFESEGLALRPHFAVYAEGEDAFYVSDTDLYRSELEHSDIKSCLSCIISFTFSEGIERLEGESDEDFVQRLSASPQHQYFSPVSSLQDMDGDKTIYWLSLYQQHSWWQMIRTQLILFVLSLILLLGLLYLFFYLLRSFAEHKKSTDAKNHFFNSMTHEFKTPLSSIRLASRVLRQNKDLTKNMTYHELIEKESITLENQIDKLLEFSLLDHKALDLDKTQLNINDCIRTAINRLKPQLELYKAQVEINLHDDLPEINGNTYHLSNCVANIIENSLKHNEGSVTINVRSEVHRDSISIIIADDGSGIDADHVPYIFDRFYRGQRENEYRTQGFGIGLSYVKYVVEAHRGSIRYDDTTIGASFTITLPYG